MAARTGADPGELLALAREVAAEAADHAREMRARGVRVAGTKSSEIDVVTDADRSTEQLLRRRIVEARPDDAILGEEGDDRPGSSGIRWIVDPIDGTVNYLYGLPAYAVSVAAARQRPGEGPERDEVVAAVVRNPVSGEEYAATLGGGATRDGRPIGVRGPTSLAESLIATGFNYERHVRAGQAEAIARMLPQVRDIRRFGSCALDLCAVAAGMLDGYVEEGPAVWDDAAGGLVAREAGAVIRIGTGRSGKRLVVCAPDHSFDRFRGLVEACGF